jgi:hypothetical protein
MKLKVIDIAGSPVLMSPEKGDKVYERLNRSLSLSDEKIELDFDGYKLISSTFLNHAFGQLCIDKKLKVEQFFNKISFLNLSNEDFDEVKLCIINAQTRLSLRENGFNENEIYSNLSTF